MRRVLVSALALCMLLAMVLTGCGSGSGEKSEKQAADLQQETITVAALKGPTSIGMIQLIDGKTLNGEALDGVSCNVNYMVADAPDTVTGKLVNGEVQIAALPTNVASVLFNKTKGNTVFLAENTLGILSLVGREPIASVDQLKGKTVAISGSGNVPQFAADYILAQNGLTGAVNLEYYSDHASVAQVLLAGDADLAILPEPFVTQVTKKDTSVSVQLDLTEEWEKASKGESILSMGCLVANKEFADSHPEFIAEFLKKYEASVDFVNASPAEAAALVATHGIIENAAVTEAAIPHCNIVFVPAKEAKDEINAFLKVLYDFEPSSVGGALPDDTFYYSKN